MSDTNSMFELALRGKVSFESPQGPLNLYDLWDLPLSQNANARTPRANLNDMFKAIRKRLRESDNDGGLVNTSALKTDTTDQLRLDIITHVFNVKNGEAEASKKKADDAAHNQKIMELINKRQDSKLEQLDIDDLTKLLR